MQSKLSLADCVTKGSLRPILCLLLSSACLFGETGGDQPANHGLDHIDFIYLILIIVTGICLKRAGYGWVGSILAALFSPLLFNIIFAITLMLVMVLVGVLGVDELTLSSETIGFWLSIVITLAWLMAAWQIYQRLMKTKREDEAQAEASGAEDSAN